MTPPLYLGADVGGTKTEGVLVTGDGTVLGHRRVPTPAREGSHAVLRALTNMLTELRHAARGGPVTAVGVGTHGVVSHHDGVVAQASGALPGWTGTPLRAAVEQHLGLPTVVDNDVNMQAYAEIALGAGQGRRSLLFVTVGTGVGGAVIAEGRLLRGEHGSGGELGHAPSAAAAGLPCSCGAEGHLDAIASGTAIAREWARAGREEADVRRISDLAAEGDRRAQAVLATAGGALGESIGGLVSVLDPSLVVVGGGVAMCGDHWWQPLRRAARASALPLLADVPITGPQLTHAGAARGAAALAARTFPPAASARPDCPVAS
ncbi:MULTISPECIES: ROK family protein [unclassified Streptomyces]|uniref:ROK family protein n=1 Tax=unclassified Streptomyces TaxID=2593676 RepID=UPI001F0337E6|nr:MULTISPECIES: ROK family protein [unclassified Streptomyces]MCH0564840.1 ROK family protein [Streptomyces sp. MUM 2J]MCH0569886.1 ROK family protein [Streptomyces sp. MUM 136J]